MNFLTKLKEAFPERTTAETIITTPQVFVLEDAVSQRSSIVEEKTYHCFEITKTEDIGPLVHICTDGDFIKRGEFYRGSLLPNNRSDSLIFSSQQILFLELKLNVEDRNSSREIFKGIDQLENFFTFLIENLTEEIFHSYFKTESTFFRIGIRATPNTRWQRNQEFINRKAQFGGKTGWYDLEYSISFNFN
ncbi:MAG: hypothetical protein H7329_18595 [Opitutaceae bacterium]|nr:hypothetical protein [Cytophagales bacterium]